MSPASRTPRDPQERRRQAGEIGQRIRRARLERGMSQADVAGDRFTKAYISALETGGALPSMHALEHIAAQLRLPAEWFLSEQRVGEEVVLPVRIRGAFLDRGRIFVELDDGRAIGMPIARSPKLSRARVDQVEAWSIADGGRTIAWPELGEEIGIEDLFGMRVLLPREARGAVTTEQAREWAASNAGHRDRTGSAGPRGRYRPLGEWLRSQDGSEVTVTFAEVARIIGAELPPSTYRYVATWQSHRSPLATVIRSAGWRASARLRSAEVVFRRG